MSEDTKAIREEREEIKFVQRKSYWLLNANLEAEAVKLSGKLDWMEAVHRHIWALVEKG